MILPSLSCKTQYASKIAMQNKLQYQSVQLFKISVGGHLFLSTLSAKCARSNI